MKTLKDVLDHLNKVAAPRNLVQAQATPKSLRQEAGRDTYG